MLILYKSIAYICLPNPIGLFIFLVLFSNSEMKIDKRKRKELQYFFFISLGSLKALADIICEYPNIHERYVPYYLLGEKVFIKQVYLTLIT